MNAERGQSMKVGVHMTGLMVVCLAWSSLSACKDGDDEPAPGNAMDAGVAPGAMDGGETGTPVTLLSEAQRLLEATAARLGQSTEMLSGEAEPNRFDPDDNVFLRSTIAIANFEDPASAEATLPLYEGVRPNGEVALYILTEAADFDVAQEMGLNYSPRLQFGAGTPGAMNVTIDDAGRMVFPGDVDFSPERNIEPGVPGDPDQAFPPNPDTVAPGAVADAEWSSLVVTPAGNVFNVQQVRNATGDHDRVVRFDTSGLDATQVTLQLLDGYQGGEQFYYHLVTDASDPVPAALELGVYSPRLAQLPAFGSTMVDSESALLGFSPIINGLASGPEQQGLGSTIVSDQSVDIPIDPINVFPLDPNNTQREGNNYSPMWDAHLAMWTPEAINGPNGDVRRRITSFSELQQLVSEGLITSFNASGPSDGFVANLNSAEAIINCPVIAQPRLPQVERLSEAQRLLEATAARLGQSTEMLSGEAEPNRFDPDDNVFLKSTIAIANFEDPASAEATLPLYEGVRPNGEVALYILTEAADFDVAQEMGLNYAPRLQFGAGTPGAMNVTIDDAGRMVFPGDVDFSPERNIEPGVPGDPDQAFPPNPDTVAPGAVADAEWSSLVVTPAGNVFNVQQVRNATGDHDRVVRFDTSGLDATQVTLQLLDGYQGGEQFYYHLVTDASDPVPAALELGVYSPRLALLPAFGSTMVDSESALLGFSPIINGLASGPEQQGLGSTIISDQSVDIPIDPINVFPLDPNNTQREGNNYSPMWDAHLAMWTPEAITGPNGDVRRRITSFSELQQLVNEGLITSFNASGPSDGFVANLNSAEAIINCPVIAQPSLSE